MHQIYEMQKSIESLTIDNKRLRSIINSYIGCWDENVDCDDPPCKGCGCLKSDGHNEDCVIVADLYEATLTSEMRQKRK